ncbi:MAG: heavy metal translocating P-type ATPase [Clostridia bacterium]|nr:heavy metal translocating P-type ATPase [Clostridia bacterium]
MKQYIVTGMSCAACQARVEKAVSALPGVSGVSVSLLTNSMGVEGDVSPAEVIRAVEKAGYGATEKGTPHEQEAGENAFGFEAEKDALKDRETPRLRRRLILSAGFLLILMYVTMGHNMLGWPVPPFLVHNHLGLALTQALLSAAVMIINAPFFRSGFKSLIHRAPNMDTLVALGSSVSFGWSVFVFYQMTAMITQGADNASLMEIYHNQLYFESAAMIPALITVGKMLEAMSKGRTTSALKSLLSLAPRTATLLRDGQEVRVPAAEVRVGDVFVVRPGESVPVDGVVTDGSSAVNEAALTGESIPADKGVGDTVSAATINQSGFLTCRATRVGEDTTLSQIVRLVSDAAATKAPIARIADRVSGVFVPAVIGIALLVTLGWLLAGRELGFSLARGISVLVISCPCALGLATPVAIMVGNGMGAKRGILFKTGESLETAGQIDIVALDKTGTITAGEPRVTDIVPASGLTEEELLRRAGSLENQSEHPLARAVVAEAERRGVALSGAEDFQILSGSGLTGRIGKAVLHGGSEKYISSLTAIPADMQRAGGELSGQGKTPLYFEEDGRLIGMIAVADTIKADSAPAIAQLKDLGIRVVMLTGDNERTARAIAAQAGVDEVAAGTMPQDKQRVVKSLKELGRVAMVGDGINDAPALTEADAGVAIGAGTDVAIDSADIVLMNSALSDVARAVRLSRAVKRNIHENLFWAFFYNLICIPLAAGLFGLYMSPMIGAAAMSLSSFTVCMNALRLNLFKPEDIRRDRPRRGAKRVDPQALKDAVLKSVTPAACPRDEKTVVLRVDGMMCEHCEATVKRALEALPFVTRAGASHEKGEAWVVLSGEMDLQAVKSAIEDEDYTFQGLAN